MSETVFFSALRQAALASQQNEYLVLESYVFPQTGIVLTEEEISKLAERILALPHELRDALFAHYYFGLNANETTRLFNLDNPKGKLNYARRLLSLGTKINDNSLNTAVEIAVRHYTTTENNLFVVPKYSNRFRRRLRDIDAVQATRSVLNIIMHRVAVVLLVFAIGFSTALVVDADFREDFFNWLIDTFPSFSGFQLDSKEEKTPYSISHTNIKLGYIPNNYKLDYFDEISSKVTYYYSAARRNDLIITFSINGPLYINTENIVVEELIIKEKKAYFWERNNTSYLIWSQNGISCNLFGEINFEEAIKIAESINEKPFGKYSLHQNENSDVLRNLLYSIRVFYIKISLKYVTLFYLICYINEGSKQIGGNVYDQKKIWSIDFVFSIGSRCLYVPNLCYFF